MAQDYKILRNSTSFKLEEHVKIALAQGYYLVGGPFMFKDDFWCQAVAKPIQYDSNGDPVKEPDMPWTDLPVRSKTPPWQDQQTTTKTTEVSPSIYDEHTPDFMK